MTSVYKQPCPSMYCIILKTSAHWKFFVNSASPNNRKSVLEPTAWTDQLQWILRKTTDNLGRLKTRKCQRQKMEKWKTMLCNDILCMQEWILLLTEVFYSYFYLIFFIFPCLDFDNSSHSLWLWLSKLLTCVLCYFLANLFSINSCQSWALVYIPSITCKQNMKNIFE